MRAEIEEKGFPWLENGNLAQTGASTRQQTSFLQRLLLLYFHNGFNKVFQMMMDEYVTLLNPCQTALVLMYEVT